MKVTGKRSEKILVEELSKIMRDLSYYSSRIEELLARMRRGKKKTYDDIFHPTTKESREELFGKILDEYKQALDQSQTTTQTENNEVQVQKM